MLPSIFLFSLLAWLSPEGGPLLRGAVASSDSACQHLSRHWSPLAPDKRVFKAPIAIKALVTALHDEEEDDQGKVLEVWVLDVYKGADKLASALGILGGPGGVFNLRERRFNSSHWGDDDLCWSTPALQKTYILLLEAVPHRGPSEHVHGHSHNHQPHGHHHQRLVAHYDDAYGAAIDYNTDVENRILKALGWDSWSSWSACSASCGGGEQSRVRACHAHTCPTYNMERRNCNTFKCKDAINTLSVSEERYFKPSPSAFHRVNGRGKDAWLIRPGSYFLLPFKQAFGREFPKDFTVFLTIRPTEESEGIIFSINARNSRQEYISLELNEGRLELVHSLANGSKIFDIPARVSDGGWHQLAISIEDGSSVRTYLDCHWITTQILHRHSLRVPENADLIIGYMFQGEIEQLSVSDEHGAASEQCSPNKVPYFDSTVQSHVHVLEKDGSDIAIDDEEEQPAKSPDKDYLDEEYVDLDWNEEQKHKGAAKANDVPIPVTQAPQPEGGKAVVLEDEEEAGSGDHEQQQQKHHADDDEAGGSGQQESSGDYELEWSSWSECVVDCSKEELPTQVSGHQSRSSRCADNGHLEECITAGMEKTENRPCKSPCEGKVRGHSPNNPLNPSGWIAINRASGRGRVDHIIVTEDDIAHHHHKRAKQKKGKKSRRKSVETNTHIPEEHTNRGPSRVPDYWVPEASQCQCLNGGTCYPGRSGSDSCQCAKGFEGPLCESPKCRPGCLNGGSCIRPDVCACPEGYTGARCQQPFCQPSCQNGGTCIAPSKCICPRGIEGQFCEKFSCEPVCANGGLCISHNVCSCPHGFSGRSCRDRTCTTHCENGGVCTMPSNKCKCPAGFYGQRCHKQICERYLAFREPLRRVFQQVIDVPYKSLCNGQPCVLTRPEYKSTTKVSYRTIYKCAVDKKSRKRKRIPDDDAASNVVDGVGQ